MSNTYAAENADATEALAVLIGRLTDEQLSQRMSAGWTVAAVLAHLAFWDQRAFVLLRQWKMEGIGPSPIDTEVINEVTRTLFLALPPRAATELVLRCARALDREIAELDSAFLAEVETKGPTVVLDRGRHRRAHMAEIMEVLELTE